MATAKRHRRAFPDDYRRVLTPRDADLVMRIEEARREEATKEPTGKLSARTLSENAGLNPSHYGLILAGRKGKNLTGQTRDKLIQWAVERGFALRWLETGEPPRRTDNMFAFAPSVIGKMITDGIDPEAVRRAVGYLASKGEYVTEFDLYRASLRLILSERQQGRRTSSVPPDSETVARSSMPPR